MDGTHPDDRFRIPNASRFAPTEEDLNVEDGEVWHAAPNASAQAQIKLGTSTDTRPSIPPPPPQGAEVGLGTFF